MFSSDKQTDYVFVYEIIRKKRLFCSKLQLQFVVYIFYTKILLWFPKKSFNVKQFLWTQNLEMNDKFQLRFKSVISSFLALNDITGLCDSMMQQAWYVCILSVIYHQTSLYL